MKKINLTFSALLLLLGVNIAGKTYTVGVNGYQFSPSTLTINTGDTVNFSIGSLHNAVEVSEATYIANDTTGNGGFRLPKGGGQVVLNKAGTYYYVCQPHVSMFGMKGIITVVDNTGTGIDNMNSNRAQLSFKISPNPAKEYFSIDLSLPSTELITLRLFDITGKLVLQDPPKNMQAGTQKITKLLNAQLKPGKYIVELEGSNGSLSQMLIKY
jgi:plastocyanin